MASSSRTPNPPTRIPQPTDATAALEALAARVARCRLTAGLFTGKPPMQAGVSLRTLHCVESGSANPMYLVIARCVEGNAQGTFFVCAVATVLTLLPKKLNGIVFSLFCLVGEKSSFRSIQERPCCAPRETR